MITKVKWRVIKCYILGRGKDIYFIKGRIMFLYNKISTNTRGNKFVLLIFNSVRDIFLIEILNTLYNMFYNKTTINVLCVLLPVLYSLLENAKDLPLTAITLTFARYFETLNIHQSVFQVFIRA